MKKTLVSDVEPLIDEKRGNVASIARALGVSRGTVWNRIQESERLQTKLNDARETMIDNAESTLYDRALGGDITALIFFLKTQGKHRGYSERQEVTGADGGAIVLKVVYQDGTDNNAAPAT